MSVTKYTYVALTGGIAPVEFARETKTQLVEENGERISKTRGYGHDFYDTAEECRTATASILENQVKAAKELLAAKRAQLKAFRAANPKKGR